MDVAVVARGLTKSYRGRRVVDDVTFDVTAGSVWALLGPNGAGKTTTVECVEGYRRPDAGDVRVLGLDPVREHDSLTARTGVVLQDGGAYQSSSARELLRLYARFYPDPLRADDLLEQVGLERVAGTRVRHLSGGERKRLDLALALVGRPELLILDEPTAGMDPEARRETWALVRRLRDDGATVLLTTHLVDEAERVADRVAILAMGRLLAEGSPAALVAEHGADGVLVTTPADVDTGTLATDLGAVVGVPVRVEATGRLRVDAPADQVARVLIDVPRWFAERGIALGGVVAGGDGLEGVVLALTGRRADAAADAPT